MSDDVDVIKPQGIKLKFSGEEIEVLPLVVDQIAGVTRALKGVSLNFEGDVMALIIDNMADNSEQIIEAVIVATGLPAEKVRKAQLDDFLDLATAVFEVNADFFVQRLAPKIKAAIEKVQARMTGAGQTQFKA